MGTEGGALGHRSSIVWTERNADVPALLGGGPEEALWEVERRFGDDPALVCGFAFYKDRSVCILGHQKGRTTKERIFRNFGQPNPEGYRKATRIFELADRFGLPVLSLTLQEYVNANLAAILYLVAGILFILALRGLSSPASSRSTSSVRPRRLRSLPVFNPAKWRIITGK